MFALMFAALAGFVGLGIDVGLWYLAHRTLQTAADAAAIAGAFERKAGATTDTITTVATREAGRNGWSSVGGTIAVHVPPTTGTHTADGSAVEVILNQPSTLAFTKLFLSSATTRARGVATLAGASTACVLGLDASAADTVHLDNNAASLNANCGVYSNSGSVRGLSLDNNAYVNGPTGMVGHSALSNNARLNGSPNITGGAALADPYANVPAPTLPPCTAQTGSGGNNVTISLNPGYYCSGWNFANNITLNLSPGTYYIRTALSLYNNATVNATGGVTIVIVGNYAIDIGNNANLRITAPATGTYAGIAIMGDRSGTATVVQTFSNNTVLEVSGAIYFPNQIIDLENNATSSNSGCSQIIGRIVRLSNNVRLGNNCGSRNIAMGGNVRLAE